MRTDNDEQALRADHFESAITDVHRQRLVDEVSEMYRQWIAHGWRYEWYDPGEPGDRSGALRMDWSDRTPSRAEWLYEYTGQRLPTYLPGAGWEYPTFGEEIYKLGQEIVKEAFEERFGPDWQDDGSVDNAACEAETELYRWVEGMLETDEKEIRPNWKKEGF